MPEGLLESSTRDDVPYARDAAIDPTSAKGEFYVSYIIGACLSRHDADGTEQWREDGVGCEHMAVDGDGNVVLAGEADYRVRVTKRRPDRSVAWTYEPPMAEGSGEVDDVAIGRDGAVVVVGGGAGPGQWVLALDADGNELWEKPLPLARADGAVAEVGTDGDGNIIVAHVGTEGSEELHLRVISYTPDGNERWSFDQQGPLIGVQALGVRASGESLLAHHTNTLEPGGATGTLVMLDAAGEVSWTKAHENPTEFPRAIAFTPCDTVVLAGMGDPEPDPYGPGRTLWIGKIDLAGAPLWSTIINGPPGTEASDVLSSVFVDEDGSITAVGNVVVGEEYIDGEFPTQDEDRWIGRFTP